MKRRLQKVGLQPMWHLLHSITLLLLTLAFAGPCLAQIKPHTPAGPHPAAHPHPFEEAAYLWTQGTDPELGGEGDWGMYKTWLGLPALGAETDPGGWNTWQNTAEGNDNYYWGDQQTRYGTAALPDVLLGIGTMPYSPHGYDLAWESRQWQLEADNDPVTMQHFVTLGTNIAGWHYRSVIIRMDYEFDGGWDPYGNLNVIPNMPGNFIKAWQNIVTTVRRTVKEKDPTIQVKFLWNPTDSNVQVRSSDFYPGDAYVDYIGFDNYDADYSGVYRSGVQPDAATQQKAWKQSVGPRVQWFADFAAAPNAGRRNGGILGRSVPLIAGEWGLWQVDPSGRPAGGDDPTYIQNMYDWMCSHNVFMESYFETPADGRSTLWPGGYPGVGTGNPSWGKAGSPYPKSAALYRTLFGTPRPPVPPAVPTGVSAVSGYRTVALHWDLSLGDPPPTYTVYRGLHPSREAPAPVAAGLADATFTDAGLENGATYFYRVQAKNRAGKSVLSREVSVTPGVPNNFVLNGGFEADGLSPWQLATGSTPGASYVERGGGRITPHGGSQQCTHWASSPYEATLFQDIRVTNGLHTACAWVKCSGGQAACEMRVSGYDGAASRLVPIPASSNWTQISVPILVKTGTLTLSFHSKASAGEWLNVDDVSVK